jgi:hypothetical protein
MEPRSVFALFARVPFDVLAKIVLIVLLVKIVREKLWKR